MTAPTLTPPGSMAIPSPRQQFLDALNKEHQTTLKVVEAFPPDQSEFKPHPRSNSARQLVWTFAVEERLLTAAVKNQLSLGGGFPKGPDTWHEVVSAFIQVKNGAGNDIFATVRGLLVRDHQQVQ